MQGKWQYFSLFPEGTEIDPDTFEHQIFGDNICMPKRSHFVLRWIRHNTGNKKTKDGRLVRVVTKEMLQDLLVDMVLCLRAYWKSQRGDFDMEAAKDLVSSCFPDWERSADDYVEGLGKAQWTDCMDMEQAIADIGKAVEHDGLVVYYESV